MIIEIKWIIAFSFLATGDSYNTLAARYRLGVSTVSMIVKNTCDVLWDKLQPEHMLEPKQNDWKKNQNSTGNGTSPTVWEHSMGNTLPLDPLPSLEACILITRDVFHLALVDADYKFIYVDIGEYGSNYNGAIFKSSEFGQNSKEIWMYHL